MSYPIENTLLPYRDGVGGSHTETSCATNVVTSCPADSIASRPPCAAVLSATSTPAPSVLPARPREARIEMPDRLDSKGILAIINRTLQALAAGQISPRRAAVLLYGIQISSSQVPQIPVPKLPVLEP